MSRRLRCLALAGLLFGGSAAFAEEPSGAAVAATAPVAPSIAIPPAAVPVLAAGPAAPANPAAAEASDAVGPKTAPAPVTAARPTTIVREVRALQQLQDRIALGDIAAHRAHRATLDRVHDVLVTAPMEAWADRRNVEAAIAYVLGGGPPAVLTRIRDVPTLEPVDRQLLVGTMAYAMGDEAGAGAELMKLDARTLPPTLAGQIAMVQATLLLPTDPKLALGYLDLAGALSAGTLVEEAALRRALVVAGGIGDFEGLERVTSRYVRRFRNSVYAGNFREKFMAAITRSNFAADDGRFDHLVELLAQFAPESRLELYLFVARRALVGGNLKAVGRAATEALALARRNPGAQARARFYAAAADITSARPGAADAAYATLLDLDPALFSDDDEALLETVLDTARQIRTLDVRAGVPVPEHRAKDDPLVSAATRDRTDAPASVREARALLERSDALLRRLEK